MQEQWQEAGEEPTVEELLNDPIAKLLRARDGLREEDIWEVIERVGCPLPRYRYAA